MTRLVAIIASAVFAVTLFAQVPEGGREGRRGGHNLDALVGYLTLGEGQTTALRDNNRALREEIRTIMQAAREGRSGVRDELNQENPNPTIVGQALVDAKATREAIKAIREEYRLTSLEILNTEQQIALEALQQALDLAPTARQAIGANLLERPAGATGFGGSGGPHVEGLRSGPQRQSQRGGQRGPRRGPGPGGQL